LVNELKVDVEPYQNPCKQFEWTDGGEHAEEEAGAQTQIAVLPKEGAYHVAELSNTDNKK
jgi:hypothetical protein